MPVKSKHEAVKHKFKRVPQVVKQKVISDLVKKEYSTNEIATMFGVSINTVKNLANKKISDEYVASLSVEIDRLNRLKDLYIKAIVKDLELEAYKHLQTRVHEAKYSDVLKTAEMFKFSESPNLTQNNIRIVMPESVKKKFNVETNENAKNITTDETIV